MLLRATSNPFFLPRDIDESCCIPHSVCDAGVPSQCNSQCAHVFLAFYNECYMSLDDPSLGMQVTMFDELAAKCSTMLPSTSCLSNNHQKQILQYLECARTNPEATQREICIQRVQLVLGLQGQHRTNGAETCVPLELNLPLLADPFDDSTNSRTATTFGDAFVADGAHFDGSGDYITVPSFDYTTNGQFSVGLWLTKESCQGNIYEYLYSHSHYVANQFSTPHATTGSPNPSTPNENVHMYVGCQSSGGGWSSIGGTVIRFNVYDDDGTTVMFDYPAWDATSFDEVTNVWISTILVVDQASISVFVNGQRQPDSVFGFFNGGSSGRIPYECIGNAGCDQATGLPILSALVDPSTGRSTALSTITMLTDIFIGGRMDLNEDRHFQGKIAGVTISSGPMTDEEVSCVFTAYNGLLPALPECDAMVAEMGMGGNFELEFSFLGDSGLEDTSGKGREIAMIGDDAYISAMGAIFDGDHDYLTIANFDYETDGDFTISFWITKDDCSPDDTFEYLYSHVQNTDGDHTSIQDRMNSNVNVYIGCESPGGHDITSSAAGSIVRFNLIDSHTVGPGGPGSGNWVLFDYPLSDGGDFDTITHTWIHVVLTVTRHSVQASLDGVMLADNEVGFPTGTDCDDMHLNPTCAQLIAQDIGCDTDMATLTGGNPIYSGQHLSDYCENSCNACPGGGGGTTPDMLNNIAFPYPSALRTPLDDFDLRSPIYL
eukprot:COSAG05_NODE_257_length_12748_cov_68.067120_7_plen_716_part_01